MLPYFASLVSRPQLIIIPLTLLNMLLIALSLKNRATQHEPNYSYIGDDFPPEFPMPPIGTVELALEESWRFRVSNQTVETWWNNLPIDFGYVRLGPEHRIFAVSMNHQHHCLYLISKALATLSGPLKQHDAGHLQHCLNYLRQNILCEADRTLEPPDWLHRNLAVQRAEARPRTCRDWSAIRGYAANNFDEWLAVKKNYFGAN